MKIKREINNKFGIFLLNNHWVIQMKLPIQAKRTVSLDRKTSGWFKKERLLFSLARGLFMYQRDVIKA